MKMVKSVEMIKGKGLGRRGVIKGVNLIGVHCMDISQ
jgi:hypothetical protein